MDQGIPDGINTFCVDASVRRLLAPKVKRESYSSKSIAEREKADTQEGERWLAAASGASHDELYLAQGQHSCPPKPQKLQHTLMWVLSELKQHLGITIMFLLC